MSPLKRALLIVSGTMAFLVITAFVLGFLFRDDVKKIVVDSLNDKLVTKVEVGNITFSFFENFPNPALTFNDVSVKESESFVTTGQVMNAEKVTFIFSLRSFIISHFSLKKIIVENALINLQVDNNGESNYKIWKHGDDKNGEGKQLRIELEKVLFKNTDVLYYNTLKEQDISFLIQEGEFSGDFTETEYALTADSKLENASVKIGGVSYANRRNCNAKLTLDVNREKGLYTFRNSSVKLEGLELVLNGTLRDMDDYFDIDLTIESPSADLPTLLTVIPEKYRGKSVEYNYSGKVLFSGLVKGRSGKNESPEFKLNFECINVNLNPKDTPYHIGKMNGKGFFSSRKSAAADYPYLQLINLNAILEGKPVHLNLEIENFKKPVISFDASLEADLNALSKFYLPDTIENVSGVVMADIRFNGVADEKTTYRSSGEVKLNNVTFKLRQKPVPFTNLFGLIHLRGNDVVVDNLSGSNGQTDFLINGVFNNLIGYLLIEKQKVDVNATLYSKKIDLDELMAKDEQASGPADTIYKLNFSDDLKFSLDIKVDHLRFRKFNAADITGTIALESKVLNTRALDFTTSGGHVLLRGSIDDRPADSLKIRYSANINRMDINNLFHEMGNFGQEVLVEKNLRGTVTADVDFKSVWSDRLKLDQNSIEVISRITIENGELIDFEPMMALSSYLKGSDLKTIKFSTLTNSIEIRNRKIYIPMMEIKSSAADIQLSGDHSFDNMVNYKLRLYLSQLMGKKVKSMNTEFGQIEDDGLGRPMIFLSMTGPAADPKITLDMNSVEKKITTEIKNETKTFKSIIKEEFGKKDSTEKPENKPKKKEELQIDYGDDE